MRWYSIKNREKIASILRLLVERKIDITVRIIGEKTPFTSQFIRFYSEYIQDRILDAPDESAQLIMKKLTPNKGNNLIEESEYIAVEFTIDGRYFQFDSRYRGILNDYPYFGIMVDLPESVKIEEIRSDERTLIKIPEFISVQFKLEKGHQKEKSYELNVINFSSHGFSLLATEKDFELLQLLKPGDTIRDMTFFAKWTMIKVEVTVRHITKIEEGTHSGLYMIGVASKEIIESCMSLQQ
jgi:hypothetical protein